MQGLDANVTQIGISRDSEGIEYIDNYALNYERVEPQYRKDARQMNMYIGLIPTGRIIERVQDRIKYYKTISEFKKEEKEPEQ